MNVDDVRIKGEAFKKIKAGSLLGILDFLLGVVLSILVIVRIINIAESAIANHVAPTDIDHYLFSKLLSDDTFIIILAILAIIITVTEIYSIYLYSRSVSILSGLNDKLKTPAKYSKYAYIVLIIANALDLLDLKYNLLSITNVLVFIIYIAIIVIEFVILLFLYIGIYRMGTIFHNNSLQLGAIFSFIPVLDIVAPFLLYSGSKKLIRNNEENGL